MYYKPKNTFKYPCANLPRTSETIKFQIIRRVKLLQVSTGPLVLGTVFIISEEPEQACSGIPIFRYGKRIEMLIFVRQTAILL